jgi:uncharacterized protein (DUF433 family)
MNESDLIARYIEPNPNRPGADEARIVGYGVSVWTLVAYLDAVGGDEARVASDYGLPLEAVQAAIAYYSQHREAIDARNAANLASAA